MSSDITCYGVVQISNELSTAFWHSICVCIRLPLTVPKQFQEKKNVTEIICALCWGETQLLSNSQAGVSYRTTSAVTSSLLRFYYKLSIDAEQSQL